MLICTCVYLMNCCVTLAVYSSASTQITRKRKQHSNSTVVKYVNEGRRPPQKISLRVSAGAKMALLKVYEHNRYPNATTKASIAEDLGLTNEHVNNWFRFQRYKERMKLSSSIPCKCIGSLAVSFMKCICEYYEAQYIPYIRKFPFSKYFHNPKWLRKLNLQNTFQMKDLVTANVEHGIRYKSSTMIITAKWYKERTNENPSIPYYETHSHNKIFCAVDRLLSMLGLAGLGCIRQEKPLIVTWSFMEDRWRLENQIQASKTAGLLEFGEHAARCLWHSIWWYFHNEIVQWCRQVSHNVDGSCMLPSQSQEKVRECCDVPFYTSVPCQQLPSVHGGSV